MLNFDQLKKNFSEAQKTKKEEGIKDSTFLRLKEGEKYLIRILPSSDGNPFKKFKMHYGLGQGIVCSDDLFGEKGRCPVCEFTYDVWNTVKQDEEKAKKLKGLFGRERYYSWVIDLASDDYTPKIWSYSPTAYYTIMSYIFEENKNGELELGEYGDITDLHKGFNLKVKIVKDKGKLYHDVDIKIERKESDLSEYVEGNLEKMVDNLDDILSHLKTIRTSETKAEVEDVVRKFADNLFGIEEENKVDKWVSKKIDRESFEKSREVKKEIPKSLNGLMELAKKESFSPNKSEPIEESFDPKTGEVFNDNNGSSGNEVADDDYLPF